MTTANTIIAIQCAWIIIIPIFFVRSAKNVIHFLVCGRTWMISLCVPWDEKGWKPPIYSISALDAFALSHTEYEKVVTQRSRLNKISIFTTSSRAFSSETGKCTAVKDTITISTVWCGCLDLCAQEPATSPPLVCALHSSISTIRKVSAVLYYHNNSFNLMTLKWFRTPKDLTHRALRTVVLEDATRS